MTAATLSDRERLAGALTSLLCQQLMASMQGRGHPGAEGRRL